jgi:hypothetical protein
MFGWVSQRLLQEMHEIGRTKLAQADQRLGARLNCLMRDLLGDPASIIN